VTQVLDSTVVIVLLGTVAWLALAAVVVAACRAAAEADAAMAAEDEAVAAAGPLGWLLSQTSPREDVADGAQEDLDVSPERPVRDVEVIHRAHLA